MYLGKLPRKYSSFIANIPRLLSPVLLQEAVGPGWVARDLSEIKPGAFSAMRSLETRWANERRPRRSRDPRPPIRLETRDERAEEARELATSDPMYRYYKRLLPPPRSANNYRYI